jgi:hypothetical protein
LKEIWVMVTDIREKSGGLSCEEEVDSLRKRLVKANNVLEMQVCISCS